VAHYRRHAAEALTETRQQIEAGVASALFEPDFVDQGVSALTLFAALVVVQARVAQYCSVSEPPGHDATM